MATRGPVPPTMRGRGGDAGILIASVATGRHAATPLAASHGCNGNVDVSGLLSSNLAAIPRVVSFVATAAAVVSP